MDRSLQAEKDIVRLPLYSDDANRNVPAGSRGFSVVSQPYAMGQEIHDSVLFNCWAEKDDNGNWIIVKRPGISESVASLADGGVLGGTATNYKIHCLIGMQAIPGAFVALVSTAIAGATHLIYFTHDGHGGIADLGTFALNVYLETGIPYITEISISGYPGIAINYAYHTGCVAAYYVSTSTTDMTGGTLTTITDVDFPGNQTPVVPTRGPFVQLNEHIFIMGQNGKIYNSDQASISSWNVRGVQPASIEPDSGVGLAKYKQHIVAFGTNSMEFFEDAGLAPPGGPLQRTEQAFIRIGCVSGSTVHTIGDTLYWIASGETDVRGLYKLDQYTPVKLSTAAQAPWLDNMSVHGRLSSIKLGGQLHLFISNLNLNSGVVMATPYLVSNATFTPTGTETETFPPTDYDVLSSLLCYNIKHNSWWWWTDESVPLLNLFVASTYSQVVGYYGRQVIFKASSSVAATSNRNDYAIFTTQDLKIPLGAYSSEVGITYHDSAANGTDTGVCMIIQLNPFEFNVESRKIINKAKLSIDALVKYSFDTSTGNQIYWIYNRMDGYGATICRPTDAPNPAQRYYLNNLGTTRKLYMAILAKNAMPMRLKALELHVTQGTA